MIQLKIALSKEGRSEKMDLHQVQILLLSSTLFSSGECLVPYQTRWQVSVAAALPALGAKVNQNLTAA